MTTGANLEGSIRIDTSSVEDAIKQVNQLRSVLYKYAASNSVLSDFNKTFNAHTKSYHQLSKVAQEAALVQKKADVIIARAANSVEQFSTKIRNSNLSTEQQSQLLLKANSNLANFAFAVRKGTVAGTELQAIQVQLKNSLSQLGREMEENSNSISNASRLEKERENSIRNSELAMLRMQSTIASSNATDIEKSQAIAKLKTEFSNYVNALKNSATTTQEVTQLNHGFKKSMIGVHDEVKQINEEARKKEMSFFNQQMKEVSSSVVLALGPLSQVASRLIALNAIFQRNAVSTAAVLASMTGLSVVLNRSFTATIAAEERFNRLNAQLTILGDGAQFTAKEIMDLGYSLANATTGNVDQFRDGAGALLQYGNIGREAFEGILVSAQGVSRTLQRGFRESLEKIAKAMQNPIKSFEELREIGVEFGIEAQKQITILQAQGKTQEAQAMILAELSGFYRAATEEGQGMTGAMSALSNAIQRVTESVFSGTDAYKSITEQSYAFAKSLDEFVESSRFEAFKELAGVLLSSFGEALRFAKDNIEAFAGLLGVTFAYTLGKATQALLMYSWTAGKDLVTSMQKAIVSQTAAASATDAVGRSASKTAASMRLMSVAANSIPLVALASGAYAVYKYFDEMDKKQTEIEEKRKKSGISEEIQIQINRMKGLTEEQKSEYTRQISNLNAQKQEQVRLEEIYTEQILTLNKKGLTEQELIERESRFRRLAEEKKYLEEKEKLTKDEQSRLKGLTTTLNLRSGRSEDEAELLKLMQALRATREEFSQVQAMIDEIQRRGPAWFTEQDTSIAKQYSDMSKELNSLSNMYRKNNVQVEEYKASLVAIENLISRMNSEEFSGVFNDEQRRIAGEVRDELLKMIAEKSGQKLSDDWRKSFDALDDMRLKLRELQLEFKNNGKEFDDAFVKEERTAELKKIAREFSNLSTKARNELAGALGITGNSVKDLQSAFVSQGEALGRDTDYFDRLVKIQDEVRSKNEELKPTVVALEEEYSKLISAAMELGNTSDAEKFGEAWSDALQKIKDEAAKMMQGGGLFGEGGFAKAFFMTPEEIQSSAEKQIALLKDANKYTAEQIDQMITEIDSNAKTLTIFSEVGSAMQGFSAIAAQSMQALEASGDKSSKAYKNFARTQILLSQSIAIAQAWATATNAMSNKGNAALAIGIASGMTAAITATMVQQLAAVNKYATGGFVSGAGTGTSDSIPAMLSNGEYVINARAVRKLGIPTLNALNNGLSPSGMKDGGEVGIITGSSSGGSSGANVNIQIIDQSTGSKTFTTETTEENGTTQIKIMVRDIVREYMRNGEMDDALGQNYGVSRKPRRR